MKKIIAASIVLCLLLCPLTALAAALTGVNISQTAQAEDALYVFFDVTDETGAPIAGIGAEDVSISLGGRDFAPKVGTVGGSGLGVGYVFAVDISRSLNEKQFAYVREAIGAWIGAMGEKDMASILTFGDEITMLTDFTADTDALLSTVEGISPTDGTTQLYNGIIRALDVAKRQSAELPLRRVLVILSDGMDDYPAGATMAEVTAKAEDAGVPIYAVGVKGKNNQSELNELGSVARLSGGELYLTEQDQLRGGYETVFDRILNGYVAAVALDGAAADGSEQGLILSVKQGSVFVEDGVDVRLKAVAAATAAPAEAPANTPAPTKTPAAIPTTAPSAQTPKAKGGMALPVIIAVAAAAAAGIVVLILSAKKRGAKKAEKEKLEEIRRRQKLDELIDVKAPRSGGSATGVLTDRTVALDDEKTVSLGGPRQRRLMLSLEDTRSGGEHRYTAPIGRELTVGRKAGEVDIEIRDRSVSGRHCAFALRNERLFLWDLNSTNGTYLMTPKGKQRIGGEGAPVKNGDVILLGETELAITVYED